MRVRDATLADVGVLVEFLIAEAREAEGLALDEARATKAVAAVFDDRSLARYWVLEDEAGAAIGAIAVTREWSDWNAAAYWWIQFVYVVERARGQRLVGRLIDHVRGLAHAAGAPELRLCVHPDNARAVRAYERLGFARLPYHVMAIAPRGAAEPAPALDDDALWIAFAERTLPAAQWTHLAHVRVAWLHLARYELDDAHLRMRAGIVRLNAVHGLVELPTRGYHETITRVWLVLIAAARRANPGRDSLDFLAAHGLERDTPLRYYSRERLFSLAARACFVAPDLAELPT
ncbi:MAG TPA: GNAT family N-acetyltransferase [Kofleriaceae bacterium]|nr:GNAT family N-acetyltransferase [Kofleriaceae bacterium]